MTDPDDFILKPAPMRQYKIYFKRAGMASYALLSPIVHAPIYSVPVVAEAEQILRQHDSLLGIVVAHEGTMFNLMVSESDQILDDHFPLHPLKGI